MYRPAEAVVGAPVCPATLGLHQEHQRLGSEVVLANVYDPRSVRSSEELVPFLDLERHLVLRVPAELPAPLVAGSDGLADDGVALEDLALAVRRGLSSSPDISSAGAR